PCGHVSGETTSTIPAEIPTQTGKTHEHHAPHNGTLVEIGEEFAHLELVKDDADGKLSAYALDGEAENSVRLTQKAIELEIRADGTTTFSIQLSAVSNPLTGESDGDSSEFSATSEQLKSLRKFSGVVRKIHIRGGDFENLPFSFQK